MVSVYPCHDSTCAHSGRTVFARDAGEPVASLNGSSLHVTESSQVRHGEPHTGAVVHVDDHDEESGRSALAGRAQKFRRVHVRAAAPRIAKGSLAGTFIANVRPVFVIY